MPRPMQQGAVECVEFVSEEPGETTAFLSEVFGWKFTQREGYGEAQTQGGVSGAVSETEDGERPHAIVYLTVRSLDNVTKRAEERGARVLVPRRDVEGGWWAMLRIPGGVNVGLFESGESFTKPQRKTRRATRRVARRTTRTVATPATSWRNVQGPRARTKRTRPARKVR